jgi:DNA gyrase inhibitor GyrI
MMKSIEVKIVQLEGFHVVSALGFGPEPEGLAQQMLFDWAKTQHLLDQNPLPRVFGFNNPDPGVGSPNYGYELWMVVGRDVHPTSPLQEKEFSGGLYAVTRCQGIQNIFQTWKDLLAWVETSPYRMAHHQWLEEHIRFLNVNLDEFVVDLYLPIKE